MNRTEMRNPKTTHIDKMNTLDILKIINEENMNAVKAVESEIENIEKAVEAASGCLKNGGRIIYIGCGTSGRLGVLDASECPPTFGVSPDTVLGIIAGGDRCLRSASENQEDNREAGINDVKAIEISDKDCLVGISVAGGAEYVLGAIEYAKKIGAVTVGITSNKNTPLDLCADISICPDTGEEVITGSTRMKAGTAQKIILNMISTTSMIKQGYVYENLMINLKPSNNKLKERVIRIVCDITGKSAEEATDALNKTNWDIRSAVEIIAGKVCGGEQ